MSNNDFIFEDNFITNVDEILELIEKEKNKFSNRGEGSTNEFVTRYGPSKLSTMFYRDASEELQNAIYKTIDPQELEIPPDGFVINRYEPGCYLSKHKDAAGKYWKFLLVFLRSDKPHLKIFNEEFSDGKLIEEAPGRLYRIPLHLEHEVTLIEEDENPKYSLVIYWQL